MLKEGMVKVQLEVFFHWDCSNKVLLGFSIEYAKVKHNGVLIYLNKMLKENLAVVLYCKDAKIRYH